MNILRILLIMATALFVTLPTCGQEENPIEEVNVVNVRIPVRVYRNKLPVSGLKKEDFAVFVNGKKTVINGFFEVKKKLGKPLGNTEESREHAPPPRLFVLIFNVSDYHIKLEKHIDTVFRDIFRPGDRYMVMTNNYFL
ncbi:MAG: hypothetical protein GY765_11155, partial [bacterium]|nr:hypothetical protein [bacterium]